MAKKSGFISMIAIFLSFLGVILIFLGGAFLYFYLAKPETVELDFKNYKFAFNLKPKVEKDEKDDAGKKDTKTTDIKDVLADTDAASDVSLVERYDFRNTFPFDQNWKLEKIYRRVRNENLEKLNDGYNKLQSLQSELTSLNDKVKVNMDKLENKSTETKKKLYMEAMDLLILDMNKSSIETVVRYLTGGEDRPSTVYSEEEKARKLDFFEKLKRRNELYDALRESYPDWFKFYSEGRIESKKTVEDENE